LKETIRANTNATNREARDIVEKRRGGQKRGTEKVEERRR
jgi:hypothetical protein